MKIPYRCAIPIALSFSLTLLAAPVPAAETEAHATVHWDYGSEHGPDHWGDMEPDYAACKAGHEQSPIDIQATEQADLPAIEFDYKPSPLRIIDNGHTVMVTFAPGSSIRVGDTRYELVQVHFHRPSEEKINGKSFEMVAHLVHADAAGHLAVIAVLMEKGSENRLVGELWKDIPKEKEHETLVPGVEVNAADLLPQGRGYYTFDGSLTTPPCTENVTWFVLKETLPVSSKQIKQFAKLYPNVARPTQPLYDRVVKETR
jgi:carbonic anhydrase